MCWVHGGNITLVFDAYELLVWWSARVPTNLPTGASTPSVSILPARLSV